MTYLRQNLKGLQNNTCGTAEGKHGNPAGVVLDADALHAQEMLAISAQIGLAETAFVSEVIPGTLALE